MSSSRSTSPKLPETGGGTLSNDALYAPLSTYHADRVFIPSSTPPPHRAVPTVASATDDGNRRQEHPKKQQRQRHSLSLQTSTSLRETSLIVHLANMSDVLRPSSSRGHGPMRAVYGNMAGSSSMYGMGDVDYRSYDDIRRMLGGKLTNRSLVLFGGGIQRRLVSSSTVGIDPAARAPGNDDGLGRDRGGGGGGGWSSSSSCSGGKRRRMRAGGNGFFGSISNKRRKRTMSLDVTLSIRERRASYERHACAKTMPDTAEIPCGGECENDDVELERNTNKRRHRRRRRRGKPRHDNEVDRECEDSRPNVDIAPDGGVRDGIGAVIENLHAMWTDYIRRLVSTSMTGYTRDVAVHRDILPCSNASNYRRGISRLLAVSEHVGMPATIVECPSRRHMIDRRCVVVDETRETWKVATIVNKRGGGCKKDADDATSRSLLKSWKIVMIPKRGTAFEVDLPWYDVPYSNDDDVTTSEPKNDRMITIRLDN
ncbi:hypothetical protein ACHAXA_006843 [Cyclostephanos tholiformis]|uniref:Uncharacterized protein n=1 Tax=Cyclostephanos tholiformis TaxID=382380 RepID=A0ABD3R8K9_9STRA